MPFVEEERVEVHEKVVAGAIDGINLAKTRLKTSEIFATNFISVANVVIASDIDE